LLTLAIVSALIVELVRADAHSGYRIETINGAAVLRLRNQLLRGPGIAARQRGLGRRIKDSVGAST
jgi:hypothetical protein